MKLYSRWKRDKQQMVQFDCLLELNWTDMETDLYPTKKTEMKVRKKTTAEIEIEMKSKRLKIV